MRQQRRAGNVRRDRIKCSVCDHSKKVAGATSQRAAEQSLVRTHNWRRDVRGNLICEFCREV